MQVFNDEIDAFLDKDLHLQEVAGYQNGNHVLYVQFWPAFLWRLVRFLLFQVFHQPLKYLYVAMDTYVDIVHRGGFGQVFFKILHMVNKKVFFAGEVFVDFPILVENVDHDHFLGLFTLVCCAACCVLRAIDNAAC